MSTVWIGPANAEFSTLATNPPVAYDETGATPFTAIQAEIQFPEPHKCERGTHPCDWCRPIAVQTRWSGTVEFHLEADR